MSSDPFYWSKPWREARARQLRLTPTCACGARATHVDHIKARAAGGAALDPTNLRSMCAPHHNAKTARHDGGFGNKRNDAAFKPRPARGVDAAGYPLAWRTP